MHPGDRALSSRLSAVSDLSLSKCPPFWKMHFKPFITDPMTLFFYGTTMSCKMKLVLLIVHWSSRLLVFGEGFVLLLGDDLLPPWWKLNFLGPVFEQDMLLSLIAVCTVQELKVKHCCLSVTLEQKHPPWKEIWTWLHTFDFMAPFLSRQNMFDWFVFERCFISLCGNIFCVASCYFTGLRSISLHACLKVGQKGSHLIVWEVWWWRVLLWQLACLKRPLHLPSTINVVKGLHSVVSSSCLL